MKPNQATSSESTPQRNYVRIAAIVAVSVLLVGVIVYLLGRPGDTTLTAEEKYQFLEQLNAQGDQTSVAEKKDIFNELERGTTPQTSPEEKQRMLEEMRNESN